ncbi:MAG TPA: DNA polymerase IV [Bacteroidales bacterium]|nr:DNA polymerase IV [Bacteroidales bacterium]HPS27705.1 DNA polymerase IV [Bacteroidales bacterium]
MNRCIVHLDLDTFFVSVERLMDSRLNGKPVIIAGASDRGVVASCSYEARAFGVHSAMPAKLAKQLCPQAVFVMGDMENYSKYSDQVTEIIKDQAPLVEKASIDEHYIDITGMDRYIKNSMLWTHELRQTIIKESGLPISFGLSVNKTVSKVATGEAKPSGEKQVDAGIEKLFLAPLSIKKIPGIGGKTFTVLRNMGIEKTGTIQQMPLLMMQRVLGENGQIIWRKANGIDNSPVIPWSEQKSMSHETTFDKDTTDIEQLKKVLIKMVDKLSFELRSAKKVCGCITLKIRYSDFQTHTFQCRIPYTASDHVLLNKVLELFRKNYSRRVLIRLIGVRLSNLVSGFTQINLYEDTEEMIGLYQSMDKIRNKYGFKAIMRGIHMKNSS